MPEMLTLSSLLCLQAFQGEMLALQSLVLTQEAELDQMRETIQRTEREKSEHDSKEKASAAAWASLQVQCNGW